MNRHSASLLLFKALSRHFLQQVQLHRLSKLGKGTLVSEVRRGGQRNRTDGMDRGELFVN